jgi:hypothetical protein
MIMTDNNLPPLNPPTTPSQEMTAAAFGGPACAITSFMVHPTSPGILRLSFVEMQPDGSSPQFRTAVVLTIEGARNLADLLMRFMPSGAETSG